MYEDVSITYANSEIFNLHSLILKNRNLSHKMITDFMPRGKFGKTK